MSKDNRDDPLAYGDYNLNGQPNQSSGDRQGDGRGIIGDAFRMLRGRPQSQNTTQNNAPQGYSQSGPMLGATEASQPSSGFLGSSLFTKLHGAVHDLGSEVNERLTGRHSPIPPGGSVQSDTKHRYGSFALQRTGNDAKWYVDGCGYMWAVSRAIEEAKDTIWILDWWLSPELYLRRPASKHQQYRLDRMLKAAAERGVKVNIIVYKEVTQALTRKYLTPTLPRYLHSLLHRNTDRVTSMLGGFGLAAAFASLEYLEAENPLIAPILTVCSSHTKHALENLHPRISVFRHPDHLPDAQTLQSSFLSSLQNLSLTAKTASQLPGDALKAIYGMNEGMILYWAHHEKLCLIDGKTAFMGGLDLCYGRWDTNQHPIADCHPSNLDDIVFPGQDYNNARIMDFQDVPRWESNKLQRKESSRMGWSDVSICLRGPVVEDLRLHFVERWNFIYNEKYDVRKDVRYSRLTFNHQEVGAHPNRVPSPVPPGGVPYQAYAPPPGATQGLANQPYTQYYPPPPTATAQSSQGSYYPPPPGAYQWQAQGYPNYAPQASNLDVNQGQSYQPSPDSRRELDGNDGSENARASGSEESPEGRRHLHRRLDEARLADKAEALRSHLGYGVQRLEDRYNEHRIHHHESPQDGGMPCQIIRSCTQWSHGVSTEHSIADAYISVIENSQYFVYIENQFFITATSDAQKPVKNKIGDALVRRILRAARASEKYKVIVVMPAVPAFAGDLKDDASLGTRAIMEFQYNSINRGGYSIMETIGNAGFDPTEYIRFYNLRNYDRINVSASMRDAEQKSGVDYEKARREHDAAVELPTQPPMAGDHTLASQNYRQYQQAASDMPSKHGLGAGRWDSVSECYMLGGADIRAVPWENGDFSEMDAFISEELYVHSKVLIADDRVVICGSANLNDRSQLGFHDSEIAVIVEDPTPLDSYMNGRPWRASKFAATLRRQLFRKHIGLIPAQNMERADQNFEPVGIPNIYDFGSAEDRAVLDPLSDQFLALWNSRARQNTDAFGKVFHPVPHDDVRTWNDYDLFYGRFFNPGEKEAGAKDEPKKPAKYQWGHVVAENFSPGAQGVYEVKEVLSTIRGTLVEMPLLFLIKEDIAKEGVGLNAFTEAVYT